MRGQAYEGQTAMLGAWLPNPACGVREEHATSEQRGARCLVGFRHF